MGTLEWAAEMDDACKFLSTLKRTAILDDHCIEEGREETIGMGYVELFHWLGY